MIENLIIFACIAFILTAFTARWQCELVCVAIIACAATFAAGVERSSLEGAGAPIGVVLIALTGLLVIASASLGLLIRWWLHRRRSKTPTKNKKATSPLTSLVRSVACGVIATYLFGLWLVPHLQGRGDVLQTLFVAAVAVIAIGAILPLAIRRWLHLIPKAIGPFLMASGLCFVIATVIGAFYTRRVIESASEVAGDRPYCIEVAGAGRGARVAKSLWDLHPFVMTAPWDGFRYYDRHASLVVRAPSISKTAHWSFSQSQFVSSWTEETSANCAPVPDFAASLSWRYDNKPDIWYATMDGMDLRIPAIYRARMSREGEPSLWVNVPTTGRASDLATHFVVTIEPAAGDRLPVSTGFSTVPVETPPRHGLSSGFVFMKDDHVVVEYEAPMRGKRATIRVTCHGVAIDKLTVCGYVFLYRRWLITLPYPHDLLPDWQKTESRLSELIEGWMTPTRLGR